MAICVRAIEFADCEAGVGEVGVSHEGCAGGAAGAVEAEGEGLEGADVAEEALVGC